VAVLIDRLPRSYEVSWMKSADIGHLQMLFLPYLMTTAS
jgi:hypothetical protein